MKRASRTAHLQLVPPMPSVARPMAPAEATAWPDRTRAEIERLYPKSDPAEVAALQDTLLARRLGICAAWIEDGSVRFVPGRLVG